MTQVALDSVKNSDLVREKDRLDEPKFRRSDRADIPDIQVAIIGAGVSGIGMGAKLRRASRDSFLILEKAEKLGGTWRDNIYPGAACDVPSHVYAFEEELNPNWSCFSAPQAEIQTYLETIFERHNLAEQTLFNAKVEQLVFDDRYHYWHIFLANGMEIRAAHVVMGCGLLHKPSFGGLQGIGNFAGELMHSARWRTDFDVKGKHVGIIGSGASAAQIIPEIVSKVDRLTCFIRTPPWVLPRIEQNYSKKLQERFQQYPSLAKLYRQFLYWRFEWRAGALSSNSSFLSLVERKARKHLTSQIQDDRLIEKLAPDYRIGCKRIVISNQFYPALARDNVEVITQNILAIHPGGVETTRQSLIPLDALILATGFETTDHRQGIEIVGRAGRRLALEWKAGARAYYGIHCSGYPNLHWLLGPNTGLGHNSVLYMIEAQINYILDCLRSLDQRRALAFQVKAKAQNRFFDQIQNRLAKSVWASGCDSWYLDGSNNINSTLWPGFSFMYRRALRKARLSDYGFIFR